MLSLKASTYAKADFDWLLEQVSETMATCEKEQCNECPHYRACADLNLMYNHLLVEVNNGYPHCRVKKHRKSKTK